MIGDDWDDLFDLLGLDELDDLNNKSIGGSPHFSLNKMIMGGRAVFTAQQQQHVRENCSSSKKKNSKKTVQHAPNPKKNVSHSVVFFLFRAVLVIYSMIYVIFRVDYLQSWFLCHFPFQGEKKSFRKPYQVRWYSPEN